MTDSKELQNLIESFNNSYEQMNLVQESLRRLAEGTFDLSERIKDFGSQSNVDKLLPQLVESREQIEAVFAAVQQQVQKVEKKVADLAESGQAAILRATNVDGVIHELQQGIGKYTASLEACEIVTQQINDFVTVNNSLEQNVAHTRDAIRELRLELQELQTVHRAIESEHNTYQHLTGELTSLRGDIRLMADENQLLKALVEDFRKLQVQSRQQAEELRKELSEDVAQALQLVDHGERRVSEDIAESKKYLQACVEATVQCRAEIGEMMERHKGICDAISQPMIGNEEQYYTLFRKVVVDVIAEQKKQEGKGFIEGLFRR